MDSLLQDLRFALRTLAKRPAFAALAALTLALGIGMTSAIYSVVHGVVFRPLPVEDAGRVVRVDRQSSQGFTISVSIPTFQDWRRQCRSFEHLGAYRTASANLTGEGEAVRLVQSQVTVGFFRALGREPLVGRWLGDEAETRSAAREVVVSERFFKERLGADPGAVGRSLRLDGEPFSVVGVMPGDFAFPSPRVDFWTPLGAFADRLPWEERGSSPGLWGLGRLKDGVTPEQLRADFEAVTARIAEISGGEEAMPRALSLDQVVRGDVREPLLILLGAVAFVLLIACANVANLLLARGESRQQEIATRLAVGASRGRVVRQLLVESVVLASAGGALGLLTARFSLSALVSWLPAGTPFADRVALAPAVVAVMTLVTLGTGLAFGTAPAFLASRVELASRLRDGARQSGRRHPLLQALVVAEMAVAVVLLVGAGLMMRSLGELRRVDPGFRGEGVLTMAVSLPASSYGEAARWDGFYDRLLERVSALPGVEHAGVNSVLPLASGGSESSVIGDSVELAPENMESVLFQNTSPGYFQAMGIPLLEGRTFAAGDSDDAPHVVMVDKTLAERYWPGESPLGRRLAFEFDMSAEPPAPIWREVVGVVGHVRHYELETPSRVELYVPYGQMALWSRNRRPAMSLVVKAAGDPYALADPIRAEVRELDADQPVFAVQTMDEVLATEVARDRTLSQLLGAFSAVALALAAIGIYGVMAWMVGERTREIGLRMALGARAASVLALVLRRGLLLAALGAGIGLAAAAALSRVLASSLYGVGATDPATYAAVPVVLVAAAVLACLVPARRASRVEAIVALRYE